MMQRVSTNFTIFFKLFIPTFWAVFFGMFTLFVLFYNQSEILLLQNIWLKIGILGFYLIFFALVYFTLFQLKRVEMGDEDYSVSDYFNTYRYIYEDIDHVTETRLFSWILVRVHLKGKSSLGKKISFLADKELYNSFLLEHPAAAVKWNELKNLKTS